MASKWATNIQMMLIYVSIVVMWSTDEKSIGIYTAISSRCWFQHSNAGTLHNYTPDVIKINITTKSLISSYCINSLFHAILLFYFLSPSPLISSTWEPLCVTHSTRLTVHASELLWANAQHHLQTSEINWCGLVHSTHREVSLIERLSGGASTWWECFKLQSV